MMKATRALRGNSRFKIATLLLFLFLSSGILSHTSAQRRSDAASSSQKLPHQIIGTRHVASRRSNVNVAALSRQEASNPPKFGDANEESEEVEPPEAIPQNMPVPAGATVTVEKRVAQSITNTGASAIGASPVASASFLASDDTGRIPPDTHGAVGPNHLVVVHNGRVRIQDRAGNVVSTVTLVGFWSSLSNAPTDIFDPKVLYDPYGARWMMTASANRTSASSSIMIGVSQTSDPTGNWNLYRIDADSADIFWADYPSIGFNKDWIVVQVNMFPIDSSNPISRTHIYVFDKANLYSHGSGLFTLIDQLAFDHNNPTNPNAIGFTQAPAVTYDPTLSTLYLLQDWSDNFNGNGYLGLSSITRNTAGLVVLNLANGTAPALIGTPNPWAAGAPTISGTDDFAPQLSTTLKIQNNDGRIQNVVYRNGSLWCVHTIFLPAGSSPTRSAVQWWQINPSNNSIQQRGRIDDSTGNTFYAFPSISVNKDNDALIGYSRYSTAQYASANYSFRAGTDPLNQLRDDTILKSGEASYFKTFNVTPPRNRWGDYSNTVVDPVNDKDMWTIQEYAAPPVSGTDRWGTWWGRVSLTTTSPPVVQLSASSYTVSEAVGSASVTVNRTGDTTSSVSVNYATSDTAGLNPCSLVNGIASSRCDYATTIGTLQFAAGETSKNISIPIVDDALVEGAERFNITLSNPSVASLGSISSATITITDNDTTTATSNPIDGVPFFVRQHYIDFLGREPDPTGFAGWQNTLNNCPSSGRDANGNHCDRIEVSSDFFRSEEFQSRGYFIYRFYSAVGRIPHYAEFMPDFARVSGFLSASQLEANKVAFVTDFMTRTDYQTKYGSLTDPTAYVTALLNTVGLPTHPTKQTWINSLTNGSMTRAQVLRAVVESAEMYQKYYNEGFVIMQYFGYLRRDADSSYLTWIQTMNSTNGDYRVMINGFLNSLEYRQRFGP